MSPFVSKKPRQCPICGKTKCKQIKAANGITIQECQLLWKPQPGPQTMFCASNAFECIYGGAVGGGKANSINSLILTPYGWKTMGDMQVGTTICNPDGTHQKVIAVFPQGVKDCYKIKFIDGAETEVCLEHLWMVKKSLVYQELSKKRALATPINEPISEWMLEFPGYKIWTTKQMIEFLDKKANANEGQTIKKQNLIIPLCAPQNFTKTYKSKDFVIHPYVLGVLLGNGCISSKNLRVYSPDKEILDKVISFGVDLRLRKPPEMGHTILNSKELTEKLKKFKLFGCKSDTKFIPEYYKWAPLEERIMLMQGLMDTDGYVDDRGHMSYTTVSEQLAKDVQHIIWSLGGKATITKKPASYVNDEGVRVQCKDAYNVYFNTNINAQLVSLPSKLERITVTKGFSGGISDVGRRIVGYEYVGKKEMQCIAVDNPNELYITDDFIVTHNTDALLFEGLRQVHHPNYWAIMFRRKTKDLFWIIERSKQLFPKLVPGCSFNESKKVWTFPSGAKYFLSHMEKEKNKEDHAGKPYQYIAFDELTFFTETQYLYLFSRCRNSGGNLRTYIRASAMPVGEGVPWVRERFIKDKIPFKEYYPEPGSNLTRQFIPAKIEDNLILMQSDPDYSSKLKALGPKLYEALRFGDWDKIEGTAFDELDPSIHMKPRHMPPRGSLVFRAMDYGYDKPFCCLWFYETENGKLVCFREWYGNSGLDKGIRMDPREIARGILEIEKDLVVSYGILDTQCWAKTTAAASVAESMRDEGVMFHQANKDRISGRMEVHTRLSPENGGPYLYITENCTNLWRVLQSIQISANRPEDVDTSNEDHPYDALRYGIMSRRMKRNNDFIVDFGEETVMSNQDFDMSKIIIPKATPLGFEIDGNDCGLNYDEELFI